MKRLPAQATDAPNAPDFASEALGGLYDATWQSSLTPFDDSAGAPAATGGEVIVCDQTSHSGQDVAAPAVLASLATPDAWSSEPSITDAGVGSDDPTVVLGDPGAAPAAIGGEGTVGYEFPDTDLDAVADGGGVAAMAASFSPAIFPPATVAPAPAVLASLASLASLANPAASSFGAPIIDASIDTNGAIAAPVRDGVSGYQTTHSGHTVNTGLGAAGPAGDGDAGQLPLVGDLGVIYQPPSSAQPGSGGSSGSPSTPVNGNTSPFVINVTYDQSQSSLPAGFVAAINYVVNYYESIFTSATTVNIDVGYGEIDGQALGSGALGESETYLSNYSYSSIKNALANVDPTAAVSMPSSMPVSGTMWVGTAEAKALGLPLQQASTDIDGYAGFSSVYPFTYNPNDRAVAGAYDFIGVVEHEFTEDMGRIDLFGESVDGTTKGYSLLDMFHYTAPGAHTYTGLTTNYFSANGGVTNLDNFNSNPNGDLGDWAASAGDDAYLAFSPSGEEDTVSQTDIIEMNALGYNILPPNGIVVAGTTADAVQGGAAVTVLTGAPTITDSGETNLTSATIKIANGSGSAVAGDELYVNGQQSGTLDGGAITVNWNAATSTLTLTGSATLAVYDTLLTEVTYKDTGTDTSSGSHPVRTVTWSVNDGTNSYNATSQVTIDRPPVANNDVAMDAAGSTITATAAAGVLSNDTDLDSDTLTVTGVSDVAHGTGTVGQSLAGVYGHLTLNANGSYTYVADIVSAINGAPTGSHPADSFTYTDSDGNGGTAAAELSITFDRPPVVAVANVALSAGHTSVAASSLFAASDPDGDQITEYGLMDTGDGHFVLNGVAQPNKEEIDVTAMQLSQLIYQSVPGSTDTLEVRANDGTVWSNWSSFIVTAPPLVLQVDGSTSLSEVGNNYFLYAVGGSSGPSLKYNGAEVDAGSDPWVPIGAVQTATGYDVAWKIPGANEYTVWSADSNGNYISSVIGGVPGTSIALESLEPIFGQDLNGDGVIGPPTTVLQVDGSTSLSEVGNNYFLYAVGGSSGPSLKYNGAEVDAGSDPWVPIGAVQTATGYDVAWKIPGANEYTVWSADSNGNYISSVIGGVPGTSIALESLEPIFGQDLNGDGVIGPPTTVLQVDGSTSLSEVGNNYFLYAVGGSSGPSLKYNGAEVDAGSDPWVPIGAVQTATGYDVAWKIPGANEYTVWSADSNGNYISSVIGGVPGTSIALESLEPIFGQDLNGDGVIGPPTTVLQVDGSTSLSEVGNNYFLYAVGGSSGPSLKYNGAEVDAGSDPWVPIGAVQTATGYDVAWKIPGANEYTVWSADSNGNYISSVIGGVPGTSTALESLEPIFGQDLNGDGVIGPPTTMLQVDGSTSLTEVGNNYFLYAVGGSSGPSLKYNGAEVDAGSDPWVPIGAVQTATGYDVAWKIPGANEYTVWSADSNGNYISSVIGGVPGTSIALESLEPIFGQDLNGDGVIGPPTTSAFSLQFKGFDYVAFFNGAYEDSDSLPSLVQTGANSIEATLDYGIDVTTSQVVADSNYTDSLAALGTTIAQAENLGLSVMVRPLIDFLNPAEIAPYSIGEWRQDYQPTNVAAFFASYKQMIVQEAEVAQANGAQMLSIGAELDQLTGPQYLSYWTDIITAVRQVFTGALTYSASWNTASEVSFWSQLNYEGIDCYVPLSNVQNPTLQELINGWTQPATASTNPGAYAVIGSQSPIQYFENLAAQSGKPLLFTELGYANDSGAAANPSASSNSPDPTLQTELYQAFFQAWAQSGNSSLIGTYFWEWDPNGGTSNVGPGIDSFSPQNSPAQNQAMAGFETAGAASGAALQIDDNVLSNTGNTISGTGTIGDGSGHLALDNASGTIEASGGTLTLETGTTITNAGTLEATSGATLQIDDSAIANTGNILVEGTLAVDVSTLTLNGTGTVTLAGGTIEGAAGGETLDNAGNTISGTGTIGDGSGHLALDNASGTIEASGGTLIVDTGTTITNAGTLEAASGAELQIDDPIAGAGLATIGIGATLEFAAADSGSVTFDGSTGTLRLDHSSTFSGQIFNFTGDGDLSTSDQIDLKDIMFGPETAASYTGNSSGGTLTVSDAQHDTANISLVGDYTNSTFSIFGDGDGGTLVVDPPVMQDLASGTFTFNESDSTGKLTASVSPQNGSSGYVGSFTLDAVSTANGQDSIGWHFNLDTNSITQTITQSYHVTIADAQPNGTNSTATQSVSVTVGGPGHDTFIFKPGIGADVIANATSSDTIELDGFSSVTTINQLQTLLNEAQTGQSQSLFQAANGGHDTAINLGNHDSITLANVQVSDLHASNFIIHPLLIG